MFLGVAFLVGFGYLGMCWCLVLVCFDAVVSGFGWVCCFKVVYCGGVGCFVLVVDGFMVGFWILLDYWFSGVA